MKLEDKIAQYTMPEAARSAINDAKLLMIAGVVGSGKNTIVNELLKSGEFYNIVSHTTRQPRSNHGIPEVNGQDYHFITLDEAEALVDAQAFVEVKYVHGNVYGTSVSEFQVAKEQAKSPIADADVKGVTEYLDAKPGMHAVFLLPPSVDTWMARLGNRYGDLDQHADEITKRFRTAYDEIKHVQLDPRFIMIINDDLGTTVERVQEIVSGEVTETSEYAEAVIEHLLDFLSSKI